MIYQIHRKPSGTNRNILNHTFHINKGQFVKHNIVEPKCVASCIKCHLRIFIWFYSLNAILFERKRILHWVEHYPYVQKPCGYVQYGIQHLSIPDYLPTLKHGCLFYVCFSVFLKDMKWQCVVLLCTISILLCVMHNPLNETI